jgi:predicted nucleotide-binding protein (sugar kinase/HSP70/actin superfamily)
MYRYTIEQKEFKRDDSPITFETKIWSKTISTGKTATISHIVKYKSSTFIVEHDDDQYKISIKHLGEVLNSYTEIHNKSLYTQEELNEIERIIETPHGWIETYYEIYDPLSIDKLQN